MCDQGDVDKWIEIAKECKYLPENDLKVRERENEAEGEEIRKRREHTGA
jgi:hypothetical protein